MPIQSTDTTSQIVYSAIYQAWTIEPGVAVTCATDAVNMAYSHCSLTNYGMLDTSTGYRGVMVQSNVAYGQIYNAPSGSITGSNGIENAGTSMTILNGGDIMAHIDGISDIGGGNRIDNFGHIFGRHSAIYSTGAAADVIFNSGSMESANFTIDMSNSDLASIHNSGQIDGAAGSIRAGALSLVNSGAITGDIDLTAATTLASSVQNTGTIQGGLAFGAGGDSYDGRGGSVSGRAGADRLVGGSGDEVFNGGAGVDKLDGGKGGGEDTFVFSAVSDSSAKFSDVITRHWTAADTIDVSALDAKATVSGNQDFTFGGLVAAGATLATGVIDYVQQGGNTYVVADTSGDGKADFEVIIHGTFALNPGEFVL